MALTDLNAAQIRIREVQSRVYYVEALKSFNAGALRAATTSTWVALVFDLNRKYRELAASGDAEASAYIADWDKAVAQDNKPKLLELERELLTHAHEKMALIDAMGLRALRQLNDDRHLCAHPAFSSEDALFEPIEETVRAHMVNVVELVLAQPPVQGKGIFDAFSADIQAPGFPTDLAATADYVEQKYLTRMRSNVLSNFGVVLGKSLVRNVPPEWAPFKMKVRNSLIALQRRRPDQWPQVSQQLVNLINADRPEDREHFFPIFSTFPELLHLVDEAVKTAMHNLIVQTKDIVATPDVFYGLNIEQFRDALMVRLNGLNNAEYGAVVAISPQLPLWSEAVRRYSHAGAWRTAETHFTTLIAPFAPILGGQQLDDLFVTVAGNGQIWNADGTPGQLSSLLNVTPGIRPSDEAIFGLYRSHYVRRNESYSPIWALLEGRGWKRPTDEQIRARDLADDAAIEAANT